MKRLFFPIIVLLLFVSCQKDVYYNISTTVNPKDAGTVSVSPAGPSVLEGASVTVAAQPKGEYVFTGWSGSFSGTDNPKTVTVSSDLIITANFALKEYPLSISVEGEGVVSESIISTKTDYASGTVVELTANATEHWLFDHWEGDISGKDNPIKITISSAKTVKAVFVEKMYPLTVDIDGNGAVNEKVISTKSGSYQEGTIVELTAIPSTGWTFSHWEGNMTSTDNPAQITISSANTVKAVFIINRYSYSLTIIGPGVVNEEIVETKVQAYNTVSLEAVANEFEGAVFAGWEGDVTGSDRRIMVNIDSDKTIVARFISRKGARSTRAYPPPDLSCPSYELKQLYVDEDFSQFTFSAYQMLQLDYNRDGYLDVVTALYNGIGGINESDRIPIGFYLGNPDGSFSRDEKNDGRIQGMLHIRKMVYGDLNKDGFPDIILIAHGYDAEPWPGEYPVILMSSPDGEYKDIRLTDLEMGFYHGGATGDIDKDGDLDIFLIDNFGHSGFLINDGGGKLTYSQELVNLELIVGMFNAELYDIDKDGYLDLICGGHDWEDRSYWESGDDSYTNTPIVFWGNGKTYKDGEICRLPTSAIEGYGLVCDFLFFDLDKDGIEELILARTGDGVRGGIEYYAGWDIQILRREGRTFVDVTQQYIPLSDTHLNVSQRGSEWLVKISIEESEIDGRMYLCGVYDSPLRPRTEKLFEYQDTRLTPLYKDKEYSFNGGCIYSDIFWGDDYYSNLTGIDIAYNEDAYQGDKCIHWKAGKAWKQVLSLFTPSLDFSGCVDDYEIEFYVKYTNPNLVLCTNIETKYYSPEERLEHKAYGYEFQLPKEGADGEWHRIHAPLSDFYHCDGCNDSGWSAIQHFKMWVTSENTVGEYFNIDEIRIRKVLPE